MKFVVVFMLIGCLLAAPMENRPLDVSRVERNQIIHLVINKYEKQLDDFREIEREHQKKLDDIRDHTKGQVKVVFAYAMLALYMMHALEREDVTLYKILPITIFGLILLLDLTERWIYEYEINNKGVASSFVFGCAHAASYGAQLSFGLAKHSALTVADFITNVHFYSLYTTKHTEHMVIKDKQFRDYVKTLTFFQKYHDQSEEDQHQLIAMTYPHLGDKNAPEVKNFRKNFQKFLDSREFEGQGNLPITISDLLNKILNKEYQGVLFEDLISKHRQFLEGVPTPMKNGETLYKKLFNEDALKTPLEIIDSLFSYPHSMYLNTYQIVEESLLGKPEMFSGSVLKEIRDYQKGQDERAIYHDKNLDLFSSLSSKGVILTDPVGLGEITKLSGLIGSLEDLNENFPQKRRTLSKVVQELKNLDNLLAKVPKGPLSVRITKLLEEIHKENWKKWDSEESRERGKEIYALLREEMEEGNVENSTTKKVYSKEDALIFTLASIFNRPKTKKESAMIGDAEASVENPYPPKGYSEKFYLKLINKLDQVMIKVADNKTRLKDVITELTIAGAHCNDDRQKAVDYLFTRYCLDKTLGEMKIGDLINKNIHHYKEKKFEIAITRKINEEDEEIKKEGNSYFVGTWNMYRPAMGQPELESMYKMAISLRPRDIYGILSVEEMIEEMNKTLSFELKSQYLSESGPFLKADDLVLKGILAREGYLLPSEFSLPPHLRGD